MALSTVSITAATELAAFMKKRHAIYLLRQLDDVPPPWTDDPILSTYRFCNVYREFDTVTIWVRQNIRERFWDHPNLWFMLAAARQINFPATLEELIQAKGAWPVMPLSKWDPEKMRTTMNARKARGDQVYTGAYMLTNILDKRNPSPKDKPHFTAHRCLGSLIPIASDVLSAARKSMEATHAQLSRGYGWGGFMAYEVVTDMRHTRYGNPWNDLDTFAHAGPGAMRGLARLFGAKMPGTRGSNLSDKTDTRRLLPKVELLPLMRGLLTDVRKLWYRPSRLNPRLELREIEHSLCEYDKYERVRLGQGKPRSLYHPATGASK